MCLARYRWPATLSLASWAKTWMIDAGAAAARVCAINLLAQVKAACGGDIEKLVRVIKLTGICELDGGFHRSSRR